MVQVVMTNRTYDPETVTVNVGDTVTWVNEDAPQHDVVADNGEFKSELFDKGQTFAFTFTQAGTYPYHCSIHPGMTGVVIVQ
jgi:plastocyanin